MTQDTKRSLHVILGAGQVGSRLAMHLAERGHRVRIVQRGAGKPQAGVEHVRGDITDLAFAESAARGASVVYDCMNPAYHQWPTHLLPIGRGALHGAKMAGAKLVALDCLYMYGRPNGAMREDSPLAPCSKKGVLRVELANMRLDAHRRGDVAVAIARASDFFGPNLPYSAWSSRFFERVYAGRAGECMGDPDMPHSYTYVEDIVRSLAALGESATSGARAFGRVWHIPTAKAESTRALANRLGDALGLPIKMKRVPKILLRTAGLFDPFMREVVEMTYQWEMPYVLDSSRFESELRITPTPVEDAVHATAAWARATFGGNRAAA